MNTTDLLEQFRFDAVDMTEPYLWSDPEVFGYINSAQVEFCRRTGGIGDFTSPLTKLAYTADSDTYATSPLILKIRGATFADGRSIKVVNYEDLASLGVRLDGTQGVPKYLITGMESHKVMLYPYPVEPDQINLVVDRLPLKTLNDSDQRLEIDNQHKDCLGYWIKYRAYSKPDSETFDRTRADKNESDFEAYCKRARAEKDRAKHKTRVTVYGGL